MNIEKFNHVLSSRKFLINRFRTYEQKFLFIISHVFVDHIYHRILTSPDIQKGSWTALYVSTACFPWPQCFMVILLESPIESESPVVLQEDCTPKMSARDYSELWCGGEVEQTQSIQQTGFLGIRQGLKKICAAVWLLCLLPVSYKHIRGKACSTVRYSSGSDSYNNLFLYSPFLTSPHWYLMS